MVFYECVVCNVKWTKLIDDGCLVCSSPCQIIEHDASEAWLNQREFLDTSTESLSEDASCVQVNPWTPMPDLDVLTLEDNEDYSNPAEPEQDSEDEEQKKIECALALLALRYSDNPNAILGTSTIDTEHIRISSRVPPTARVARFTEVFNTQKSSFKSPLGQDGTYERQEPKYPAQNDNISSNRAKFTPDEPPKQPAGNDDSVQQPNASKKKKKTKKTGNRRPKHVTIASTQVLPKLELPDPIPSPIANNSGGGEWSSVVKKGVAKAAKKAQNNATQRAKERENVNASSYLARNDKNERPAQDRSAIAIRVNVGGAKHDVKRIIPRSVLE